MEVQPERKAIGAAKSRAQRGLSEKISEIQLDVTIGKVNDLLHDLIERLRVAEKHQQQEQYQ